MPSFYFTFHNVSISTLEVYSAHCFLLSLHSTMYLFLLGAISQYPAMATTLHSTMYLFLPPTRNLLWCRIGIFTFHNVSISTCRIVKIAGKPFRFTFHNVSISTHKSAMFRLRCKALHSTMYLFLRVWMTDTVCTIFSLHSTMYLFLPNIINHFPDTSSLYIPQCIYFYQ